jgi:type II secretory pathway component PulJ
MNRQSGITLVELLVTIVLSTIVGLFIVNMYITSNRTYIDQNRILDAQRSGRLTLEAVARVLRQAGLDPKRTANAGIEVAETARIHVTMDLNLDGDVDDSGERVTFRRNGRLLQKGTGAIDAESWQTLAEDVEAFAVEYYGDNNAGPFAAPITLGDIRSLIVTLTLRDEKASGGNFERPYSTGIYCRNLAFR